MMDREQILAWLQEEDPGRLTELWNRADRVRANTVGDEIHLRGLVEVSNHCRRDCAYCGIRRSNRRLVRYRLNTATILECAAAARQFGCRTVVLQGGEDPGLSCRSVEEVVTRIKLETGLAVTLSLGERSVDELARLRTAGADRYLLRFETSNQELLERLHPPLPQGGPSRLELLHELRRLGYEIGSGVMVGLPGTRYEDLASDLELFCQLDLDMIGVGPYVPHPQSPLSAKPPPRSPDVAVPATAQMTHKVLALARLVCPEANLPATTALDTVDPDHGRRLGLTRGANVWMPTVTPPQVRARYDIYPRPDHCGGSRAEATAEIRRAIAGLGRSIAAHPGARRRRSRPPDDLVLRTRAQGGPTPCCPSPTS